MCSTTEAGSLGLVMPSTKCWSRIFWSGGSAARVSSLRATSAPRRFYFERSLQVKKPPADLSPALLALWYDGRGDWNAAHGIAQDVHDPSGSWVHAYLHRKEGDDGNAGYWYRRAGVAPASGALDVEWRAIVEALLVRRS
jgi:hypothetical protein